MDEERKGFEIKCLTCGSTDCSILEDWYDNYDDEWIYAGCYIQCNSCGSNDK